MFVKLTTSGPRRYVQLVEAFRDAEGRTRQRTIASLGRLEVVEKNLESLIKGLRRVTGAASETVAEPVAKTTSSATGASAAAVEFEPARALGNVWTLTALWNELGFDRLGEVFKRSSRRRIPVEQLIRVLVFNRLCDPDSKLGVLRWLSTVCLPGIDASTIRYQHLLRAMDALIEHRERVDEHLAKLLVPLIDTELAVVFYDLTTIRAEGLTEQTDEVRRFGRSKDGGIRRQFVLGVVQTADGIPIHHEVFDGNVAEVTTFKGTLERVMARFPIRRVIAVADRGLMSSDNLTELEAIRTPSGEPLEYILAVPGRRYGDFVELLGPLHRKAFANAETEAVGELAWNARRLVVAHDPVRAAEQRAKRNGAIDALEAQAADWVGKLDDQEGGGKRGRGRPLSDGGARAKFYHAVLEARLGQILRVDLKSKLFTYTVDAKARQLAELMDGKLLVVTNVAAEAMVPDEVVRRYKALADIERGFRVLKSEIEIGPVHHRLPDRIRAHAMLCFIALIVHRVMRRRLKAAKSEASPERALWELGRIQHHRVRLAGTEHRGVTTLDEGHKELLESLGAALPTTTAKGLALL